MIPLNVRLSILVAIVCFPFLVTHSTVAEEFELKNGDRVVFLGSEYVEQQIKHNFFEAAIAQRWPDRKIVFRNLGWSGDTPSGIARGYFGDAREGFSRLKNELDRIKPTVIFVCYGANAEAATFEAELAKLIPELKSRSKRLVFVSHPAAEGLGEKFADVTAANKLRKLNAETMRKASEANSCRFVDLFGDSIKRIASDGKKQSWTTDSIRFNRFGYQQLANLMINSLEIKSGATQSSNPTPELLGLLLDKNELYFHRYRPQNETYLRGFRKHEQGQNAKEIAEFDALIAQSESRIQAYLNGKPLPAAVVEPDAIELTFEALSPDEQKSGFTLADGLEINLFASEPMVANPIHMNFDSKGRLWVATSPIYPQIKPGAKPRDEIIVLEDTDNDGRADKRTVFANDLLIPTAVLPDEQGGCYVANSTEMLHLSDTDGDGVADQRRVVLAGFGTEDTHHIIHTFRWGPDTALFFNQSIYIHTHMETPSGVKRLMGSGIWRFEPEKVNANVLMRGLVNPWGHIFDQWGQSFATDGASGFGINYAFPGSAYVSAVGFRTVLRGMNPGQPKLCGLELISKGHFSEEWAGSLVTNDFRGNRINRFKLSPQGSGYISKQVPDMLSSKHRAFRPVDLKMAPDGSLFVADWYNPIINHGEIDFRDSRRDYKHGRIWRVTNKGKPTLEKPDFESAELAQLVELANSPSHWNRAQARIELKRRDPAAVTKLLDEIVAAKPDLQLLLNTIWTYEAIGHPNANAIETALTSSDHRLRAAAVRILSNRTPDSALQNRIAKLADDEHPQVRLEFINAWRRICSPESIEDLLKILNKPLDTNLEFALSNAIRDTSENWIGRLSNDDFIPDGNQKLFVLQNVDSNATAGPLLKLLRTNALPEKTAELLNLISQRANVSQLQSVFDQSKIENTFESKHLGEVLQALLSASQKRGIKLSVEAKELEPFFAYEQTFHLAGLWKLTDLGEKIKATAIASKSKPAFRISAVRGLAAMDKVTEVKAIASNPDYPIFLRKTAIEQIAVSNPTAAANYVAEIVSGLPDNQLAQAQSLLEIFLKRQQGGRQLAIALKDKPLSKDVVNFLIGRSKRMRADGKILAAALPDADANKANPSMEKSRIEKEMANIVELVNTKGNPQRGELIYRRDKLGCIKCHSIGGAGGVVGPDMISLGASSPVDYIVQSLVDPNAKIKEGYHTTTLLTADGKLINGKLMGSADGKLTIRDAENKEITLDEADIDEQKISPISLMPADLVSELSRTEFVDLVAFLSALGKDGSFKVSPERIVRRWILPENKIGFSKVDGAMPLNGEAVVSFEINVTKAGMIGIQIDSPDGLDITLDDTKDILRGEKIVSDLPVGRHRYHFAMSNKKRESIRVTLVSVDGSDGYAEVVNQ